MNSPAIVEAEKTNVLNLPVYEYYVMAFRRFAEFNGRSVRSEFWWFMFFHILVMIILDTLTIGVPAIGHIIDIYGFVSLVPMFSLISRRLHDMDYSFKIYAILNGIILAVLVASLGYVVFEIMGIVEMLEVQKPELVVELQKLNSDEIGKYLIENEIIKITGGLLLSLIGLGVSVFGGMIHSFYYFVIFIQKGTVGPNRFGEDLLEENYLKRNNNLS